MPNKLSEIFSDDMFNINGKMRFKDEEAYKNFLSALEVVQKEGRVVPIEGVTSIVTEVQTQGQKYPLQEHTNISELVIGPAVEELNIDVYIAGEKKNIQFRRYTIENGIVLETRKEAIIYFKLVFRNDGSSKHTLTYKAQFELATNIQEIITASNIALALMDRLYNDDDLRSSGEEGTLLIETKNRFKVFAAYFTRVLEVEKALNLSFEPKYLSDISYENQKDIEELYLLLCKKEIIRINAKVNSSDITLASPKKKSDLIVGSIVKLCFMGTIEYQLFGNSITLHSANLLTNAVVKEIKETDEGSQVFYGDTDARPMYISYSAYLTEEEAQAEADMILEHEQSYTNAKTVQAHIENYNL
ncbi:MAG: hypothetical protein J6B48_07155 [Clostridia bacterium]|nr:hypothetical protein [Clostridia bacterium]